MTAAKKKDAVPTAQPAVPPKRPVCVLGLKPHKTNQIIERELQESGLHPIFTDKKEQILEEQLRPECFAVFVDLVHFMDTLEYLRSRNGASTCYWVGVSTPAASRARAAVLYNAGLIDLLTTPVHPFTYKSRARSLLARYVNHFEFPEDIELPAGISRRPSRNIHDLSKEESKGSSLEISRGEKQESKKGLVIIEGEKPVQVGSPILLSKSDGIFGVHRTPKERLEYFDQAAVATSARPQLFVPVAPEEQKKMILKEVSDRGARAILWTHHQKWKCSFDIDSVIESLPGLHLAFPSSSVASVRARVGKEMEEHSSFFLSFSLNRARIFTKLNRTQIRIEQRGLVVQVPGEIFETQRRTHYRLAWQEPSSRLDVVVQVQPDASERTCKAVDISASGCKLIFGPTESLKVKVGQTIPKLSFMIYERKVSCSGTIKWKKDGNVGIQFLHLNDDDQMGLQLYVMEESYAYFKSYIVP